MGLASESTGWNGYRKVCRPRVICVLSEWSEDVFESFSLLTLSKEDSFISLYQLRYAPRGSRQRYPIQVCSGSIFDFLSPFRA